jgi:hypothetical protein
VIPIWSHIAFSNVDLLRLVPKDNYESYRMKLFMYKFNEELVPLFMKLLMDQDRSMDEQIKEQILKGLDKVSLAFFVNLLENDRFSSHLQPNN